MKLSRVISLIAIFLIFNLHSFSKTLRVLFLGNSYVSVNNLPQIISDIALSNNDSLIFENYSPGGYTLQNHFNDANSIAEISQGNWDYVVLQEQSQLPSFPIGYVQTAVYPYAHKLDSLINLSNSCTETMFYMTWGRKNGDASNCSSYPPVCSYEGMDSLLNLRYRTMAFDNNGTVSPVGAVWHFLRTNNPSIELYQIDESHPSAAGSYAAACTFYSTLFRKDPLLINYDYSLHFTEAFVIRLAVQSVAFNNINQWYVGAYDPKSDFSYINSGVNAITFQNNSINSSDYYWEFDDGATSNSPNPTHVYSAPGQYQVKLIATKCGQNDTSLQSVNAINTGITNTNQEENTFVYPNPASTFVHIKNLNAFSAYDHLEIVNTIGDIYLSKSIDHLSEVAIDLNDAPKGFYFITLLSKDNSKKVFPIVLN